MSMDPEDPGRYTFNPAKPRLMMEYLEEKGLLDNFLIDRDFPPLPRDDFYIAHTKEMVNNFFDKGKTSRIRRVRWTPEYARAATYESANLYYAIRYPLSFSEDTGRMTSTWYCLCTLPTWSPA